MTLEQINPLIFSLPARRAPTKGGPMYFEYRDPLKWIYKFLNFYILILW